VLAWLGEFVNRTCATPPLLVGASPGGSNAERFAAGHGGSLARLVLLDAGCLAGRVRRRTPATSRWPTSPMRSSRRCGPRSATTDTARQPNSADPGTLATHPRNGGRSSGKEAGMRVLVTGGTGFVGSHTVAALVEAGYQVRLLVRARHRVAPAVAPLGLEAASLEAMVGDVTDPAAVDQAVAGCQAVVHAASVYSLDSRDAGRIRQVNVRGTELVLGAAQRAGLDPIVYVSSTVALLPPTGQTLTPDSPPGHPPGPYLGSKADAERVARRYQQAGAPVVITYPGFVLGPHDPHLSEGMRMVRDIVKGRYPMVPRGDAPTVDVRDVAAVHAAVLEPGRGPRRYLASGTNAGFAELVARLRVVTGRRLRAVTVPAGLLLPVGRAVQLVQQIVPFHIPAEFEGIYVCWCAARYDDTRTREELGVAPRDLQATLADTVRWLVEQGHISPRQAGQLATA
jgi:dihydroflavonol-4-reductase